MGYQSISTGGQNILVCGGQESMSNAPHTIRMRDGKKLGAAQLADSLMLDGLTDALSGSIMGETAENVAKHFGISRIDQDEYAARSQQAAAKAQVENWFVDEIVGVPVTKRGVTTLILRDEFPKNDTTADGLALLKPCFIRVRTFVVESCVYCNFFLSGWNRNCDSWKCIRH